MKNSITFKCLWVYGGVLALALLLHILHLDARPLHHDESLHATFGFYWYDNAQSNYIYRYDPTYHGPFLYVVIRVFYELFGVGVTQARLVPLVFGLGILFSPLLFMAHMGRTACLMAVGILAVSPLMTYYSRFAIHDMPALFFAILAIAFFLRYQKAVSKGLWLFLAAACLGIHFSIKATAFLHCLIFVSFGVFYWGTAGQSLKETLRKISQKAVGQAFLALSIFLVSYAFFQTSFFQNPQGFADGLYRAVIPYWWGQHVIERVKGPVIFHVQNLLLHELPIVLCLLAALSFVLTKNRRMKRAVLGLAGFAVICALFSESITAGISNLSAISGVFKIKTSWDLLLYVACFVFGLLGTLFFLLRREHFLAFANYWTFSSLFIYSCAGEKVPWLTVYLLYPAVILTCLLATQAWMELKDRILLRPVLRTTGFVGLILILAYQLRLNYYVNHVAGGEPGEMLSQVHNHKDVKFVVDWMNRTALETGERPEQLPIAIFGSTHWAFYFYLIENGYKRFTFNLNDLNGAHRFVITDEQSNKDIDEKLKGKRYFLTKLNHNGWWSPETLKSWKDWIQYAWSHKRPGIATTTPLFVYYKPREFENNPASQTALP